MYLYIISTCDSLPIPSFQRTYLKLMTPKNCNPVTNPPQFLCLICNLWKYEMLSWLTNLLCYHFWKLKRQNDPPTKYVVDKLHVGRIQTARNLEPGYAAHRFASILSNGITIASVKHNFAGKHFADNLVKSDRITREINFHNVVEFAGWKKHPGSNSISAELKLRVLHYR
jgi:hypothetical protein